MRRLAAITVSLLCAILTWAANPRQDSVNRAVFDRVATALEGRATLPAGELVSAVAMQFLGTPYAAGTLETVPEELNVYLDRTDCILFAETCLCMALTLKSDDPTYEAFVENVRLMRYRDGKVDGYPSRLHYTSDWIRQNASRGILDEYTCRYGTPLKQQFNFMSTHTSAYRQLKNDPAAVSAIRKAERSLEQEGGYCVVTQQRLKEGGMDLREGDLVFFVSKVAGLDITHVGILHRMGREWHFIHASSKAGKVIVESRRLADYAVSGVRLARVRNDF